MHRFWTGWLLCSTTGTVVVAAGLAAQVKIPEAKARADLAAFAKESANLEAWRQRAAKIRSGILRGAALDPLPRRTPLRAVVHSERALTGYTVANVSFESFPGFFVTGNLYRPRPPKVDSDSGAKSKSEPVSATPHAGILCPHGHWAKGRFRHDMQARCATFARAGAVVFAYDMAGWQESTQIDHRSDPHTLTYQVWNSIRAIDFLLAQAGVDPKRLAVTGASGGGTQSFLLAALDSRIAVSAPVVMVSAHFFGGCNCESGLPIHRRPGHRTNNAEIAALAAPRPLLLVSNGKDWTKNTPVVEFPFVRRIYGLYGATAKVENAHFAKEGHDYGVSKRQAVYRFLAEHLGLSFTTGPSGRFDEAFLVVQSRENLLSFDEKHPRPKSALSGEHAVLKAFRALQGLEGPAGSRGKSPGDRRRR